MKEIGSLFIENSLEQRALSLIVNKTFIPTTILLLGVENLERLTCIPGDNPF